MYCFSLNNPFSCSQQKMKKSVQFIILKAIQFNTNTHGTLIDC